MIDQLQWSLPAWTHDLICSLDTIMANTSNTAFIPRLLKLNRAVY